jgi:hypothetical protein
VDKTLLLQKVVVENNRMLAVEFLLEQIRQFILIPNIEWRACGKGFVLCLKPLLCYR